MSWKSDPRTGHACAASWLRVRIPHTAILLVLACAPTVSCVNLDDFFSVRVGETPESVAAKAKGEATQREAADGAGDKTIEAERRDVGIPAQNSAAAISTSEIGVKSKARGPFAEVRQQLARLMRTGSAHVLRDDSLSKGISEVPEGYFVQIGSHQLLSAAEGQLSGAKVTFSSTISDFDLRVRPANLPAQGRFFRVQIGPLSSQGAALDLCRSLQAKKQECFILAEASPKIRSPGQIAMVGEWASIAPGEYRSKAPTAAETGVAFAARGNLEMADAASSSLAPGVRGLPQLAEARNGAGSIFLK